MNIKKQLSRLNRRRLAWVRERRSGYTHWITNYEREYLSVMRRLAVREKPDSTGPLISVVMPVYRPDPEYLRSAIESVRNQIYKRWELCIADDCSNCNTTTRLLEEYAARDHRIKHVVREQNGHISAASNSALAIAGGEFVALLDQDDLLAPHALLEVALAASRHPDAGIIYSDEDKINDTGRRFGPYFKSGWNLFLFRSHNMISHLGVYRRELMIKVGGFRVGLEGSQDYDLALRCSELLRDDQIVHIPQMLYHWRVHESSTAMNLDAKPYAVTAAVQALSEHLVRSGVKANGVEATSSGYRVHYCTGDKQPVVMLWAVTPFQTPQEAKEYVLAMARCTTYAAFSVMTQSRERFYVYKVIDGQLHDEVMLEGFYGSPLLSEALIDYAPRAEYICFVDKVLPVNSDWLKNMLGIATQTGVGLVGGKIVTADHNLYHAGYALGGKELFYRLHDCGWNSVCGGRAKLIREVGAVSSAAMLLGSDVLVQAGGYSSQLESQSLQDIDLCLKVSAMGKKIVWTPDAVFRLLSAEGEGAAGGEEAVVLRHEDEKYFRERWGELVDYHYSPHLSLRQSDCCLDVNRIRHASGL